MTAPDFTDEEVERVARAMGEDYWRDPVFREQNRTAMRTYARAAIAELARMGRIKEREK